MTPEPSPLPRRGTFEEYVAADDVVPLDALGDADWDALRRSAGWGLTRRFCTLRNLLVHRGRFAHDAMGFAWGGIYRTLFVGSIVTTSYRNEGHFRSGERIRGTSDFFSGSFAFPRSSAECRELVRMVNLRHHVAGVVRPTGTDRVTVEDVYEADYAYVATAFIESIRRGLDRCGLPPGSRRGRELAWQVAQILYQLAGLTGLTRMPRDLAAHERFRDAFDRRLGERPPSARVRRMAQEIARRIAPVTALHADATVRAHVARHLDPDTREFLFPGGEIPDELETRRLEWRRRLRGRETLATIAGRTHARQAIWDRPDVAALHAAYREAVRVHVDDEVNDRLIGAILLHALDAGRESARPLERRTIELAAGAALIRQGQTVGEMYVVLAATAPLVVLFTSQPAAEPRQVATLAAPTVLGEIGMWRGQPAVATVLSREPNRLDVVVIDRQRFESLKQESGFRAATASEVQRRLSLNAEIIGSLLDHAAASAGDARLASIAQLVRYLTGDSHVRLDAVIGLPDDATPAECVESLRMQVDEVFRTGGLPADLERYLANVVATIG